MSSERMITQAMQEQPIVLLAALLLVLLATRVLARIVRSVWAASPTGS
jgi:hypothetical protein